MLTTYVTTACDNRTQSAAGGKLHLSLSRMHEAQIVFAYMGEHTACSLYKHILLFLHKLKYAFGLNLFYEEIMQSQITENRTVSSILCVSNKLIISGVKAEILLCSPTKTSTDLQGSFLAGPAGSAGAGPG